MGCSVCECAIVEGTPQLSTNVLTNGEDPFSRRKSVANIHRNVNVNVLRESDGRLVKRTHVGSAESCRS